MNVLTFVALATVAQGTSIFEIALDSLGLIGTAALIAALARRA